MAEAAAKRVLAGTGGGLRALPAFHKKEGFISNRRLSENSKKSLILW
jgi:hypothetical protein